MANGDDLILGAARFNTTALNQARLDGAKQVLSATKPGQAGKLPVTDPKSEEYKAATEFEGLLIKQMLTAMWKTVEKGDLLSGGREEELYRDMYNDAFAEQVSKTQSIGVRDVVLRELQKRQSGDQE